MIPGISGLLDFAITALLSGMSLTYSKNMIGPRANPCGTPALITCYVEIPLSERERSWNFLFVSELWMICVNLTMRP